MTSLRFQLISLVCIAILLIAGQAVTVAYFNSKLNHAVDHLTTASQTRLAIDLTRSNTMSMVAMITAIEQTTSSNMPDHFKSGQLYIESIKSNAHTVSQALPLLGISPEKQTAFNAQVTLIEEEFLALTAELNAMNTNIDADTLFELAILTEEPLTELVSQLSVLNHKLRAIISNANKLVGQERKKPILYGVILAITASVLLFCFGLIFVNRIVNTLNLIVKKTERIAAGHLNIKPLQLRGKDELSALAESVNSMADQLRTLITEIKTQTNDLTDSSMQFSQIASNTKVRTQEQNTRIRAAENIFNEVSLASKNIDENTSHTLSISKNINDNSQNVHGEVVSMLDATQCLNSDIDKVVLAISDIDTKSKNISTILDVITSISEQTNLLALNAAIESARAGESGRGFAVVADEVRTLANRTQQSTIEIKNMIDELTVVVNQSNILMTVSAQSTKNTVVAANTVNTALDSIFDMVSQIDTVSGHIGDSVAHQNNQIKNAITIINELVYAEEQALLEANQTEEESNNLVRLGNGITQTVSQFTTH